MMMLPFPLPRGEQTFDGPPISRGFFEYHAGIVEPWDGLPRWLSPMVSGSARLFDRNGLRLRVTSITKGRMVFASEAGVLTFLRERSEKGSSVRDA